LADADRILRRIADRQLSLVTRKQALAADISESQLRHRLKSGVLRKIHGGVYLFGAGALTFEQRALAACLACGDAAYVAGRSAAAIWGILAVHDGPIEVTPDRCWGRPLRRGCSSIRHRRSDGANRS
jgi:hypothetical protein